ncbi:hypothetical protein PV726_32920 [Streptomyces europaeiscabiei]|uniref:hypothetical protein n=1 Tax=Streptomyces europaeiscabiei TaxID=146819 RepID=UPI0029ADD854|nr:hypothetical protein [Streptomyces europaeiscabiei]MDX3695058.1 hypothetical protein [Streptomyces europaeiscabiei]
MVTIDAPETRAAVFAAAAASTYWETTNLGHHTKVWHDGCECTVELDHECRYLARITYRYGWGGTEFITGANATQEQHCGVVKAFWAASPSH